MDAAPVVRVTVNHLTIMSNNCPLTDEQACSNKARPLGVCDRMLVGFVLWSLVHATEALAAEPVQPGTDTQHNLYPPRQTAPIAAAMSRIPAPYQATSLPEVPLYSSHEFRPRGASLSEGDAHAMASEPPLMGNTTVWQRLSDYRTHDRFSLVTLWETGGNSLSLQAGKRGDPTLQWTSRLMSRPGAGRGFLDELFSTSVGGIGRNLHFNRAGTAEGPTKAAKVLDAGLGGSTTK
jgi:hypothetical protein